MGLLSQLKTAIGGFAAPPPVVDPQGIPTAQLQKSHAAGLRLREIQQTLADEGRSLIDVVMNGNDFEYWQMYPWQGGILDQRNHSQYFYHAHDDYKGEHGHFHTFYYQKRKLVHLVAIGMDRKGRANKLYTFNRWGPGDSYFPAAKLKGFLPRYSIGRHNDLDARLHGFVNDVLVLFQPEIEHLFDERDVTFDRYREAHNGDSPFEDRSLEITSQLDVDVEAQTARIAAELARRGAETAGATPREEARPDPGPPEDMPLEPTPLAERELGRLKKSYQAGLALRTLTGALQADGRTVQQMVMNGKEYEHWAIYPWDGGVEDKKTRSQYFYHSHPQSPEHGHFHVFYNHRSQLAHLVAISLDNSSEAMELFTVNRWVTGDFFLPAKKLSTYITQFRITNNTFDREVGEYITHMLVLYQEEIAALISQRDRVFEEYRRAHNGRDPYEDRDLDVTSNLEIRVEHQIAALQGELKRRGALQD